MKYRITVAVQNYANFKYTKTVNVEPDLLVYKIDEISRQGAAHFSQKELRELSTFDMVLLECTLLEVS